MAEKKGLIQKLIIGKDKADGYARSTLPSNRWELFWDILKGRFWNLVIINLMLIVGFLPTILVFFLREANMSLNAINFPFSGSYIIGYPQYTGLTNVASAFEMMLSIQTFAFLIPALLFASIVLAGIFNILRNMAWNEGVFIANDFWKGLKSNVPKFLAITLLFSIVLFITNLNIATLDNAQISSASSFLTKPFVNALLKWITYLFAGFFTIMTFHCFTLIANYELTLKQLIRNSFLLTLGLLVQNIVILVISFVPFIIMLLFPSGMLIGLILGIILLLGLSCAFLGWTIYSHWVFDKFVNPKIAGAVVNRGIYPKVTKDGKPVNKKSFSNPKKKRAVKPVTDEEISITELPTAFSRADLQKLSEEKEIIRKDSEDWAENHQNDDEDLYDEDSENSTDEDADYVGYEDAMKLEGYDPEEGEIEDEDNK